MSEYVSLLKKQVYDGKITPEQYHIILGRHYGYPECCIKNFVNMMSLGIPPWKFMNMILGHVDTVGYVQCPICYN